MSAQENDQTLSDQAEPGLPPVNLPELEGDRRGTLFELFFESDDNASSFNPEPTSGTHLSDEYNPTNPTLAQRREIVSDACLVDSDYAKKVLATLSSESEGWCELVKMQPSKEGGYIQVSYGGANKFTVLEKVVIWADGQDLGEGEQCSHLCHRPRCKTVGHVWAESAAVNNSRKNCLVWIDCHHCPQKIFLCTHIPCCIKFCPGFTSMDDLKERGVCRTL